MAPTTILYIINAFIYIPVLLLWKICKFRKDRYRMVTVEGKIPLPLWTILVLIISFCVPVLNILVGIATLIWFIYTVIEMYEEYDEIIFPGKGMFKFLNKNLNA